MATLFREFYALCFVGFIFLLLSCDAKTFSDVDMVGKYELMAPGQSGSLNLFEDGTYEQTLKPNGGIQKQHSGRWTFNAPSAGELNRGTVRIYGALTYLNGTVIENSSDYSIGMPVYAYPHGIDLFLSADGNEAYSKRK